METLFFNHPYKDVIKDVIFTFSINLESKIPLNITRVIISIYIDSSTYIFIMPGACHLEQERRLSSASWCQFRTKTES